ncbi:hypothetical protein V5799_005966 [Amblyomma americanum]|uniref:Uncharacterized protein n=2 Tax=Amblyomma americanum TaxID=6943 RepID=A0AAQ4DXS5_AMBAM
MLAILAVLSCDCKECEIIVADAAFCSLLEYERCSPYWGTGLIISPFRLSASFRCRCLKAEVIRASAKPADSSATLAWPARLVIPSFRFEATYILLDLSVVRKSDLQRCQLRIEAFSSHCRMSYYDAEMGGLGSSYAGASAFSEKAIRHGFIRKVYGILMVQLGITAAFIALFIFEPNVVKYSRMHPGLYISAMVITFVLMIVLACCDSVRRSFPVNLILLMLFTVCEGVLLGTVSSFYEVKEVMIAVGICTIVCLGLTLFAFQTKWDFTAMSGILFVAALVFMCFGFALIFIKGDIVRLVYACIGALLFSVYLVFDTQLMLGGNHKSLVMPTETEPLYLIFDTQLIIGGRHKFAITPEEYIFAALTLYVDVITLFLYILEIVSRASGDRRSSSSYV